MSWARLDDGFPDHRKVEGLSAEAFRSFVKAVCYCARNLTDGRLPVSCFPYLGRRKYLDELITAALFENMDDGALYVHDYLQWNPSREKVLAERAATAARVARLRNGRGNGVTNAVTNGSPVPVPIQQSPTDSETHKRAPAKGVDEEFIQTLVTEFASTFDEDRIRFELDKAENNKRVWDGWRDKRRGFRNWLKQAKEWAASNGTSGGRGAATVAGGYAGDRGRPVGSVRGGGDSAGGAFPVAKQWPPASNE